MLGAITAPEDRKARGLHITYPKREPEFRRRIHGEAKGGAVRLDHPVEGHIAIGEGIETCLAWRVLTGQPVWAAMASPFLPHVPLPKDLKALTVIADFDGAGIKAAEALVRRAEEGGIDCRIELPGRPAGFGLDFNDALRQVNAGAENIYREGY